MTPGERVQALIAAARRLADAGDALGARARHELEQSTGLSPQNVELVLGEILETRPAAGEITTLCASVGEAPAVHVVLAASVFSAPLRAIALGLAQSDRVRVRPSRREPAFTRLLQEAGGAFEIVAELAPAPGDHVWLYGTDATLAELRATLPPGSVVHAHGAGFGIALVDGDLERAAAALADDVVPFDQRGCLSPRVAFVLGSPERSAEFAAALGLALERAEHRIPLGRLDADELADIVRWRDSMAMAGEISRAGRGWVSHDASLERWVVPPVGRNVAVLPAGDFAKRTAPLQIAIAAVGVHGDDALERRVREALPNARISALGRMQRPPLDGPVDRRPVTFPEVV